MLNAMTVDVEDYFQVSAFEPHISRDGWDNYPCRVEANTRRVLELFAEHDVHGTFFTLGWVAERYPELIEDILKVDQLVVILNSELQLAEVTFAAGLLTAVAIDTELF